jgi:hypothetical protein
MRGDPVRPPFLEQRQPVLFGQHQVQDDQVVVGRAGFVVALVDVLGQIDGKTLLLQPAFERPG